MATATQQDLLELEKKLLERQEKIETKADNLEEEKPPPKRRFENSHRVRLRQKELNRESDRAA